MTGPEVWNEAKVIFKNVLNWQIAEAASIDFEKRDEKIILNSKSEYNQCKLPRID